MKESSAVRLRLRRARVCPLVVRVVFIRLFVFSSFIHLSLVRGQEEVTTQFDGTWTQMKDPPWIGRFGHELVVSDSMLLMLGGAGHSVYKNDVWETRDCVHWARIAEEAEWGGRAEFKALVYQGAILLFGGLGWGEHAHNDVWLSDDSARSWRQVTVTAPWSPRSSHEAVIHDGIIILAGGISSGKTALNDVWKSSNGGIAWTQLTRSAPWLPRANFGLVESAGALVVIGGESLQTTEDDTTTIHSDVWVSRNTGKDWQLSSKEAEFGRRFGFEAVAVENGKIAIFGGYSADTGSFPSDIWSSENAGGQWTLENLAAEFPPAIDFKATVFQGAVVVTGGYYNEGNQFYNDVWVYGRIQFHVSGGSGSSSHKELSAGGLAFTLFLYFAAILLFLCFAGIAWSRRREDDTRGLHERSTDYNPFGKVPSNKASPAQRESMPLLPVVGRS